MVLRLNALYGAKRRAFLRRAVGEKRALAKGGQEEGILTGFKRETKMAGEWGGFLMWGSAEEEDEETLSRA